jgi:hypothetical protein
MRDAVLMAAACRHMQLLLHSGTYRPYADVDECTDQATRRVLIEDQQADLCLFHSLQACERLGARFVRTLTRT